MKNERTSKENKIKLIVYVSLFVSILFYISICFYLYFLYSEQPKWEKYTKNIERNINIESSKLTTNKELQDRNREIKERRNINIRKDRNFGKPIKPNIKKDIEKGGEVKPIETTKNSVIREREQDNKRRSKKDDGIKLYLTSYNPEVHQTDSTPCIAGCTCINLCDGARDGKRYLALSQELISWSVLKGHIKAGQDDWRCNGEFIVVDEMNIRYRKRGDIFFLNRKDNISCNAIMYLK